MSDCCTPKGYRQIFSERGARAQARDYRRKGPDATSRRIVLQVLPFTARDHAGVEGPVTVYEFADAPA